VILAGRNWPARFQVGARLLELLVDSGESISARSCPVHLRPIRSTSVSGSPLVRAKIGASMKAW